MKSVKIGALDCAYVKSDDSANVCYMLSFAPLDDRWVSMAAERYGCSIVVVTGMDWDNDLTPWRAPGVPYGCKPFAGNAGQFLSKIIHEIIPEAERSLGLSGIVERTLAGVSLSGLFAIWAWIQCDTFKNVVSISGSFWYENFTKWISDTAIPKKTGLAYISLGRKEPYSPVKAFRTVGDATDTVVDMLKRSGIQVVFNWEPGTHYAPLYPRLTNAMDTIFLGK